MPELVIKYKSKRTLEALMDFAKYFEFSVVKPKAKVKEPKLKYINGVACIPGDPSIDISDLETIFTGKNLNAKELRKSAWARNK